MVRLGCRIAGTGGYLEYSGIGDGGRFLLDVGFGLGVGVGEMTLEGRGDDRVASAVGGGTCRYRMALGTALSSTFCRLPPAPSRFRLAHEVVDDDRAAPLARGTSF